jgi:hypothetical protein
VTVKIERLAESGERIVGEQTEIQTLHRVALAGLFSAFSQTKLSINKPRNKPAIDASD